MELSDIGFNFDEMTRLANDDPEEFARRREELIQKMIRGSARTEHLVGLQMDLDAMRYCTSPGVRSGERIVDRLLETAVCMNKYLSKLNELLQPQKQNETTNS